MAKQVKSRYFAVTAEGGTKKRKISSTTALCEGRPEDGLHACVKLSNGVLLPWVGFGTYGLKDAQARSAPTAALEVGYRSVDTAFVYGGEKTEAHVGKCVSGSGLDRSQVFVTTKMWRKFHGYENTVKNLETSLKRLQMDYVDLYLIHWPGPAYSTMHRKKAVIEEKGIEHYFKEGHSWEELPSLRAETWRAMEDALADGKCKAIGVSNFTVQHLKELKKTARVMPMVNQVEFHPYHSQVELLKYCREEGIVLQAYASLGGQDATASKWEKLGGPLMQHETVVKIAQAHKVTPAQVLLKWALQQGVVVIPKSVSKDKIQQNADTVRQAFTLSDTEMAELGGLDQGQEGRLCWKNDPLRDLSFA